MQGAAGNSRGELSLQRRPADGTVIGSVSRNIPIQAALGRDNLKADPRRFGWLGGSGLPSRVCYVAQSSPITEPADLFERELIVGGAGAGSSLSFLPIALQRVLHMKFRLVEGYRGIADAVVALQRGEIEGICHGYNTLKTTQAALLRKRPDPPSAARRRGAACRRYRGAFDLRLREQRNSNARFCDSSFRRWNSVDPILCRPMCRTSASICCAPHLRPLTPTLNSWQRPNVFRSTSPIGLPAALQKLVDDLFATPKELVEQVKTIMPAPGD